MLPYFQTRFALADPCLICSALQLGVIFSESSMSQASALEADDREVAPAKVGSGYQLFFS